MLSILIPTYNYNVFPLVENLYNQCVICKIPFEIIVFDDASTQHFDNEKINLLENTRFEVLEKNIGRSAIRNLLAKTAKYDWLLFLDADVLPNDDELIKNYLNETYKNTTPRVVYGGIRYQEETPERHQFLRWIYGNKREAISASERNKDVYLSFLTLNFLIHKSVFERVCFNEEIPNLRNEDLLFSYDLKQTKIIVNHIENWVYHLGIETSDIFLKKTNESSIAFLFLLKNELIPYTYTPYGKAYKLVINLKLKKVVSALSYIFKSLLIRNLKSKNPSMFLFDVYRLGYLCSL